MLILKYSFSGVDTKQNMCAFLYVFSAWSLINGSLKKKILFECWTVLAEVSCRRSSGLFPGTSIPFCTLKQNGIINTAVHCHITGEKMFPFFNTTKPMDLNSKLFLIFCICIINVWRALRVWLWTSKSHFKYKLYT